MAWEEIKPVIYDKWKRYWFDTHPKQIATYSWDYLFTGGKQIRPRLFCELWKYLSPDSTICGELAFAIECIHVASLILDDMPWMDNAPLRREKPTLHTVFSERKACLLFHDVLYMVYLLWTEHKPAHIHMYDWEKFMIEKLMYLAFGQWYDLEKKGTLIELASLKTGILFELITETVALCTELDRPCWKSWGNHLGILFQWMDDLHDREEDGVQGNRNAFNEAYDTTMDTYISIWKSIETGIGKSWFTTPFGMFMKSYFTDGIVIDTPPIFDITDVAIPYPVTIEFPVFSSSLFTLHHTYNIGSHYIEKIYHMLRYASTHIDEYRPYLEKYKQLYMHRYCKIKQLLWSMNDMTWEHQPIVVQLATELYHVTMKDMKQILKRV
jgi:geranylgeranyl pyrophosphate synthase